MTFGKRLSALLERAGLTQFELARRVGVRSSAVTGWIAGAYFPRHSRLVAIARELGVSPGELVDGSPRVQE